LDRALERLDRALEKLDRALVKLDRALERLDRALEKFNRALERFNRALEKLDRAIVRIIFMSGYPDAPGRGRAACGGVRCKRRNFPGRANGRRCAIVASGRIGIFSHREVQSPRASDDAGKEQAGRQWKT
jgi:hypothetical protein